MGIGKIIIGSILALAGLWALLPTQWYGLNLYVQLLDIIKGTVPILLVFIGAILVWIEIEELKVRKPKKK